jgi:hypothetical protein
MKKAIALVVLIMLVVALPAFGKTYKNTYATSCSELWLAVKDVLSNTENYDVIEKDDAKMHADYSVKHSAHVNISGAILQRTNKVTLVPKGTGCEMQVVSNYSGWEHNDQGDFKKRVDDSQVKALSPGQPAKPADSK